MLTTCSECIELFFTFLSEERASCWRIPPDQMLENGLGNLAVCQRAGIFVQIIIYATKNNYWTAVASSINCV